jgi:3-deoxy-D-manno-octulosonic-acid transferase
MLFFYNLGIQAYTFFIKTASLFNPKAKFWIDGRIGVFEKIESQLTDNESIIWIHVASLGEFEQGRPLIESIKKETPDIKILLTFFSPSGYEIRKNYPHADIIAYLPIDTKANAKRFLDIVKPQKVIFVKYEFWYHYLNEATSRNIPTIYIAALFWEKMSYFKWYFSFFIPIFQRITHYFVQDINSKDVLEKKVFGNKTAPISIVGDPRVDRVVAIAAAAKRYDIIDIFAKNNLILVAGSTWEKDEQLLHSLITQSQDWKFIIAPHEIKESRLQFIENQYNRGEVLRFSQATTNSISQAKILLIDNIGMLSSLYFYGKIAYIGGGFGSGIHNTLEPMAFGIPVIFGPKYQNFEEAKNTISNGGSFSIRDKKELYQVFFNLSKKDFYENASQQIKTYIADNQGATKKISSYLLQ